MSFIYEKYSATGNDFLIVDIRNKSADFDASLQGFGRAEWAKKICDRHFGLGADGLVLIEEAIDNSANLKWDFYNSDGSEAEMCGNAARSVGRWAQLHLNTCGPQEKLKVQTLAGLIQIEGTDLGEILVHMSSIQNASFAQTLEIEKQTISYSSINSGVPHAVIEKASLADRDADRELARVLRRHSVFGPRGTNVTFYKKISDSEIEAVSFERGVEDFTLSCGTGAVAAAYDFYKQTKRGEIRVKVPGGDLKVRFLSASPQLIGPAIKIASCTLA